MSLNRPELHDFRPASIAKDSEGLLPNSLGQSKRGVRCHHDLFHGRARLGDKRDFDQIKVLAHDRHVADQLRYYHFIPPKSDLSRFCSARNRIAAP